MKQYSLLFLAALSLWACSEPPSWQETDSIDLLKVKPIGLVHLNGSIWLSDGDNNQLQAISMTGEQQQTMLDFDRPMHLATDGTDLYVPEYGLDQITKVGATTDDRTAVALSDSLDAPGGVAVLGKEMAIADFYKHRIVYFDGSDWINFGTEGNAEGEFYYPTDVELTADKIYVADAYNNRVQVFDKTGKFLQSIGEAEEMNAATGLYVSETELFVTDFEHDRVLVYDLEGNLVQAINDQDKPTDLLLIEDKLYIANYGSSRLYIYTKQ